MSDDARYSDDLMTEKWFVLNWVPGGANITENPKHECFDSEREAIAYAKECARDECFGDGEVFHVMRTVRIVSISKRVTVHIAKPKVQK